jgi:hypothetical protein
MEKVGRTTGRRTPLPRCPWRGICNPTPRPAPMTAQPHHARCAHTVVCRAQKVSRTATRCPSALRWLNAGRRRRRRSGMCLPLFHDDLRYILNLRQRPEADEGARRACALRGEAPHSLPGYVWRARHGEGAQQRWRGGGGNRNWRIRCCHGSSSSRSLLLLLLSGGPCRQSQLGRGTRHSPPLRLPPSFQSRGGGRRHDRDRCGRLNGYLSSRGGCPKPLALAGELRPRRLNN